MKVTLAVGRSALVASLAFASHAYAGDKDAPAQDAQAPAIEEIVVTAQKRSENLQNVPIAVSAVTESQLARVGVSGITDLKIAVPTLNLTNSSGNLTSSLRGIGSNGIGAGVESPVAVYIDGVYIASPTSSLLSLNNIAQIEVLKGPQGTLFGRNATGGLIQVRTLEPSSDTQGRVSFGYANYDTFSASAYLAGALSENIFMDIAATGQTQGKGWGTNRSNGEDVYKVDHDLAVRSKLIFQPSSSTKITLAGDYSARRDSLSAYRVYPGTISGFTPDSGRTPDIGYDVATDTQPHNDLWVAGGSLRLDQEIGSVDLMSLTAYRAARLDKLFDYDGGPEALQSIYQHQHDKQFSQEVQLSSRERGSLQWIVGAYYFNATSSVAPFQIQVHNAGIMPTIYNQQGSSSIAGYGQLSYALTPATNLTIGGRYTSEERTAMDGTRRTISIETGLAGPVTEYGDITRTFNKFTYRASLDHRFSREVLAYASFNRGFKSGGFNTAQPGTAPFEPETLDAYEVGIKTDLLDGKVRFNAAGFYYDYQNLQIQKLNAGAITVINGAKARNYGLDADVIVAVTPDFRITGGIGWIDPQFSAFPDCPISVPAGGAESVIGSCAGNLIPLAAKFTGSFAADYTLQMSNGALNFGGNLYYNSGFYPESDNVIKQTQYAMLGASIEYKSHSGYTVGLFAKNLTDRRVINFETTIPNGTHTGYFQAPRTYGVNAGFRF